MHILHFSYFCFMYIHTRGFLCIRARVMPEFSPGLIMYSDWDSGSDFVRQSKTRYFVLHEIYLKKN